MTSRRLAARSVNALITTTYWEIGRLIVQLELEGKAGADYADQLLVKLAGDLSGRFGRGVCKSNLYQMRNFFLAGAEGPIFQTPSGKSEGIELILCTSKNDAVAHYALDRLPNKVLASRVPDGTPAGEINCRGN
jgi:hypothetical protein